MAVPQVAVVDYGFGNLRSVAKALARSGVDPRVTSDPADLRRADAVVLPGVGAFADAATSLAAKGLDEAVRGAIEEGRPYLGLCLGL
ncbi:MAG: imidazole glycerol phosphate synthase subunit HisH, partial [Myxococcales bacterium]